MAILSVTAVNLTTASIFLPDLGETVPASGTLVLSENQKSFEIFSSADLAASVSAGDIVLDLGSGPLTSQRSQELFSLVTTGSGTEYDDSGVSITASSVQEALDLAFSLTDSITTGQSRIEVYDAGGGASFTTQTQVVFDTVRENTGGAFTLLGSGQVQCNTSGNYRVVYDVSIGVSLGSARSNASSALFRNNAEVPGTRRYSYHREAANGAQSATGRAHLTLSAGDLLDVRSQRDTGTDTLVFLEASTMTVEEFGSGSGPQGPMGAAGVGTNINISINGDLVSGGPFETINFIGDSATAVDAGSGRVNLSIIDTSSSSTQDVAQGSTLGLEQTLLAEAGQIGQTVLAVGYTHYQGTEGPSVDHKAQISSLGDGNVVFVYASGADFVANVVQEGPIFLSLGEVYVIENIQTGSIITSSAGAYGCSQQRSGNQESPMPLLSLALSFEDSFVYGFRNSSTTDSYLHIVNGPLASSVSLEDGSGNPVLAQTDIAVAPWSYIYLDLDGVQEYRIRSTGKIMACVNAYMADSKNGGFPRFYDSRLVFPVVTDGITWPRQGQMSAPYSGTEVDFYTNDGFSGSFSVSPGSPVDLVSVTGANDDDYEPAGATRFKATGLITAYSGADSAGLEATPLCPTAFFTQRIALPLAIELTGDGGNNGIALASCYEGTARLYEWNPVTGVADLVSVEEPGTGTLVTEIPLVRRSGVVSTRDDQNFPASVGITVGTGTGGVDPNTYGLTANYLGGYIEVDVPCSCVFNSTQNANGTTVHSFRGSSGSSVVGIHAESDEQLTFGITPEEIRTVIRQGADGLLYRQVISAGGVASWTVA